MDDPKQCAKCKLNPARFVEGQGNSDAEVILLGSTPGDVDVRRGRPFTGPSNRTIIKALQLVGVERMNCWLSYSCCCQSPTGKSPSIRDIRDCIPRLYAELKRLPNRKVIVAMGAVAMKALFPTLTSLTKERGRTMWHEELNCTVVITHDPGSIWKEPKLFQDFANDFIKINRILSGEVTVNNSLNNVEYVLLDCQEDVDELCSKLDELKQQKRKVALDVENDSQDNLLCIGLSWLPLKSAVLTKEVMNQTTYDKLSVALKGIRLTGHYFKSDINKMWFNGFSKDSVASYSDTMYQSYLLDERRYSEEEYRGVHGLKYLAREFLFVNDYNNHIAPFYTHLEDCPEKELYEYNAKDAAYTLMLDDMFEKMLTEEQRDLLHNHMCPVSDVLAGMEYLGIKADRKYLEELDKVLDAEIEELKQKMYVLAGQEFNPNSNAKQVPDVFYNKLGIPIPGAWSVDREHLKMIIDEHPIIPVMLDYRKRHKFHGTYIKGILKNLDDEERVHTQFNVARTVTGRLSSNNPNLQNITRGSQARNIFTATPGWQMFECDLSQAEVKGLCWIAKDRVLHEAIISGLDLHTRTASLMYNVPFDKVTKAQRTTAKRITFGLIYQMTPEGLVDALRSDGVIITLTEALRLMDLFFEVYVESKIWIENIKKSVLEKGYVVSPFGRYRRFPLITENNKAGVLRQAVNFPIQSMANEISLGSLLRFGKRIERGELGKTRLLSTVHDSVLGETKEDIYRVAWELKTEMEKTVLDGWVPFTADVGIGTRWGALKKPNEFIIKRLEGYAA